MAVRCGGEGRRGELMPVLIRKPSGKVLAVASRAAEIPAPRKATNLESRDIPAIEVGDVARNAWGGCS